MNTGYFIQNGNNIMKGIDERFTQAFKDIQTAFETVRTDFRNEWVGSDEVAFENKLVEKLNLLSMDSHKFAQTAVDTVKGMLDSWVKFQDVNTMDGSSSGAVAELASLINTVNVVLPVQIATVSKSFSAADQLGLKSASSSTVLHGSLNAFITTVRNKIDSIFEVVNSNQAFYGEEQMTGFTNYIKSINETMKDLQTSVKDLDDAMVALTGEYKAMDTNVNTQLGEAKSTVDSAVDLGSTRWTE